MTPAARVQSAIDLLDAVIAAARDGGAAADAVVADYFRTRRYAGSKDRRAVRDLTYAAIRRFGDRPDSGRAALVALADADADLAARFDGSPYGPAPIRADEPRAVASAVPGWLTPHLHACIDAAETDALLDRAPLDLRINPVRADASGVRAAFPDAVAVAGLPDALRLPHGAAVEESDPWRDGWIEIQDAASQHAVAAMGVAPGMTVVDLCAGAGGKTLALAAAMHDGTDYEGHLIACDVTRARLAKLAPRAERAGVPGLDLRLLDPRRERARLGDLAGAADRVLVDAPCSGSGTWRRSPELRWRLTPDRLAALVAEQARLIDLGADLVAPGGELTYAVCAVTRDEGPDQVAAFLARRPGWTPLPAGLPDGIGRPVAAGFCLTPAHDATDGFFFARLRREPQD